MMKLFVLVSYVLVASFLVVKVKSTKVLPDGCKLTKKDSSSTTRKDDQLPMLTCSGTHEKRLQLNFTGGDNVKSIVLSYNKLSELQVDDFKPFPNLVRILVTSNNLKHFHPSAANLSLYSVRHVLLGNNKLKSILKATLKSFPNLTTLHLHGNRIEEITKHNFRFNEKLQKLRLDSNPIAFKDEWMKHIQLTELNLRGCGLTDVPSQIKTQKSLKYLDLSKNLITKVLSNSFSGCSKLRKLQLQSNDIRRIQKNSFKGAENLAEIDLSENRIKILKAESFGGLKNEKLQINLFENPILCNCTTIGFKHWLDILKLLNIDYEIRYKCEQPARNHGKLYHQITAKDFSCQKDDVLWTGCSHHPISANLKSLPAKKHHQKCHDMCYCYDENGKMYHPSVNGSVHFTQGSGWLHQQILANPRIECEKMEMTRMPQDVPVDVKMIDLQGNKIKKFNFNKLKDYKELQSLCLAKNKISELSAVSDIQFPSIKGLLLQHNHLPWIMNKHLKPFPYLETLALYHNRITFIPIDLFQYNRKILNLHIGGNPIQDFKADFLKGLSLRNLSLRKLSITSIPKEVGDMTSMVFIDLSENQITTLKAETFSKCKALKILYLENNKLSHIDANAFSGAVSLKVIMLSSNKITTLPSNVFSNISPGRLKIELWLNPLSCDCALRPFKKWVEEWEIMDSTSDIKFRCHQPLRLHKKVSNEITAKQDFKCDEEKEKRFIHDSCSSGGQIAAAVLLSMLFTGVACAIAWRCTRKKSSDEMQYFAQM